MNTQRIVGVIRRAYSRRGGFRSATAFAALTALFLAGTDFSNSASAETVKVDVGLKKPVIVDRSKPLKIALFMRGQSVSGLTAVVDGVVERSKELGVHVDVFNANFDSATMVNQMQNALLRDYTGWIVFPTDGSSAVCNMITKEAPAANVLVSVNVVHVCVDPMAEGQDLWARGTIGFVGGNETLPAMRALVRRAAADHPGKVNVAIMHGLILNPVAKALVRAAEEVSAKDPSFNLAVKLETNWDTADALAKATPMFLANRNLDVIITQHALMSRGVLTAMEVNNVRRPVKIYEFAGTKWSADMVAAKKIEVTLPFFLKTNGKTGVSNLHDVYYKGAPIPKFTSNDGHPPLPGSKPGAFTLIDAKNVANFEAEYN